MPITNITTEYIADEDRVRLAVTDSSGAPRVLWLTRRLAERLAPALVESLAQPEVEGSPSTPAVSAAQTYAQLEARLTQKPAAAVKVPHNADDSVVYEIKLTRLKAGGCRLRFLCKNQSEATLNLNATHLRQWLELLRLAFKRAQWRQDVWPNWIQGSTQ